MHWCAYPLPTHSVIQAKKQLNKSANTEKQQNTISKAQHNRQPRVVNAVGVTDKTAKWLQKNELQKFLQRSFSKTQVFHRHRSIDRQEWEHKLSIRRIWPVKGYLTIIQVN